ncbi:MAG: HAD-IG family 5'-nucleotidase [Bacteriovoracaceae bacterium]
MGLHVNRILNFKKIKAIGLDMDYTLVRYHSEAFETLSFNVVVKKLIQLKNYPEEINSFKFDYKRAIRGLVIDKKRGNLLKVGLYSKVKMSYHGTKLLNYEEQEQTYQNMVIDLNDPQYFCIDTPFSISHAVLFSNLVDLKDKKPQLNLPDYDTLASDVLELIDLAHRDDSLKSAVRKDIAKYIIQDPDCVSALEEFKKHGKKIWVITNSDYSYCKLLLDYTITPFLKNHQHWSELFDLVITLADKPKFFTEKYMRYLKIDRATEQMSNLIGPIKEGVFQGGSAFQLQRDLKLSGDEILYIGDHMYGDIVSLKKAWNWRTALVIDELEHEMESLKVGAPLRSEINKHMHEKEKCETKLDDLYGKKLSVKGNSEKENAYAREIDEQFKLIHEHDQKISQYIKKYQELFNPYWGEIMRAGAEESRFAGQIEKYACIYICKIGDFKNYSPRKYFRPRKRFLPHEIIEFDAL